MLTTKKRLKAVEGQEDVEHAWIQILRVINYKKSFIMLKKLPWTMMPQGARKRNKAIVNLSKVIRKIYKSFLRKNHKKTKTAALYYSASLSTGRKFVSEFKIDCLNQRMFFLTICFMDHVV